MIRQGRFTDLRFWALAWLAVPPLVLFALYFWGRRRIGDGLLQYPWALAVGLPMAVGNVAFNVLVASLIFLRLPVWRNGDGAFSPYFTTRIKHYRRAGIESRLCDYLAAVINLYDPGHFAVDQTEGDRA